MLPSLSHLGAPTATVCVKLPEQRLCRGLLAELPMLTPRGHWTISRALALKLANELKQLSLGDPAAREALGLWMFHLRSCELRLIEHYEAWAALARVPPRNDARARELWAELLASRRALAGAIVEAHDQDGHVYPLSNARSHAPHLGTPAQVRQHEAEMARRRAGAPPPGARDGQLSMGRVRRVLLHGPGR